MHVQFSAEIGTNIRSKFQVWFKNRRAKERKRRKDDKKDGKKSSSREKSIDRSGELQFKYRFFQKVAQR